MIRQIAFWGSALLGGGVLAAAVSAGLYLGSGGALGVKSGVWSTNLVTGSPDAGLYTRAVVAIHGLLALGPKETVYYTANTDSSGRPLSGDCTYRLEGEHLPARWWSITPYGPDYYLIPTGADHYSLSQTSVQTEPDGSYTAIIAAEPRERNWLPVKAGQRFDLTARLYNPETRVHEQPGEVNLPGIIREDCS